ncbi:NACHT, LRR and PYD domains-containing protein 3-like [Trichomycterus rosablanca]|uniref:NACHT, LRR and PYD domains-containing protein 3-like n=1 Tax=Trichomycterus rosablanca TaxID=2290929 RepID=UPI002F35D5DA
MLVRLIHFCRTNELQQEAAALLTALQNKLDFSSHIGLDLTEAVQDKLLYLTTSYCEDIISAIQNTNKLTELILEDCRIEDTGVNVLFSILHNVRLRCSKAVLLQFLSLVSIENQLKCCKRALDLTRALDRQVDLSETRLDLQACKSLALLLEFSEGLSELDLSHCQLTDDSLEPLLTHLHKTAILDLSHNKIDDRLAKRIYKEVSTSCNIQTVRLFNNRITDKKIFQQDKRFEIW